MHKKNKFGIISGAGPMAGALLYQLVIEACQSRGAWRDQDFPAIFLLNVPFSEMLLGDINNEVVREELLNALSVINQYADYVYIACQTLHIFLTPEEMNKYKVISLLSLINPPIHHATYPLRVVGSHTSRLAKLHQQVLTVPCEYIEHEKSEQAIDAVLKGESPDLLWLEALTDKFNIILGCTEFSVALKDSKALFIDPIKLAAKDIITKFYC